MLTGTIAADVTDRLRRELARLSDEDAVA